MSARAAATLELRLTDAGTWQTYIDGKRLGLPFSRNVRIVWEYGPEMSPAPDAGITLADPTRDELRAVMSALCQCNSTPLSEICVIPKRSMRRLSKANEPQLVLAACRKSEAPAGWYVLENCFEDMACEDLGEIDLEQTSYGCAERLAEALVTEWGLTGRIGNINIQPII